MKLFSEGYLSNLFLAFIVVVLSYCVGRIITLRNKTRKHRGGHTSDFSSLIRREILRLSGAIHPSSLKTVKKKSHPTSHKVIQVYKIKIKVLKESNKDYGQIEDLKKSINLFEATLNSSPNPFKSILNSVQNISKIPIPLKDIIKTAQSCLKENIFILSEEQREVMSYKKIKNLITARTLLYTFIQDALLESSTICKVIERGKNKSPEQVYLAILLLVLLKSGATEKALYETALQQPKIIREKFKSLKPYQKNNSMMALLRVRKGEYLLANQVIKIIQTKIQEFEQFKKDFIQQKSREQEKKRKKFYRKNVSTSHLLEEYYKTLGCHQSDSTTKIKKCYRKLALKNHPDRVMATSEISKAQAHEGFLEIQQAYSEIIKIRKKAA